MERRGVVEKSRVLQAGRTDEKITPELSSCGSVAPRFRRDKVEQAGSLVMVGQAQDRAGPRQGLGLPG